MRGRRRILVFTSSFPGASNPVSGVFIYDLAKVLASQFDVTVLAPAIPGDTRRYPAIPGDGCREFRDGVKILRFRQGFGKISIACGAGGIMPTLKRNRWLMLWLPFFIVLEFFALARTVRREKIDLIHAHWLLPQGLIAAVYCMLTGHRVKLLTTCHGADLLELNGRLFACAKRFSLRHADAVTVVSELLRRKAEALGAGQSRVLPMGVDTGLFSPEAAAPDFRARMKLKRNVIIFVGSLIERKGVRALVDAMPEVIRVEPDTSLLLIGGGPLERELKLAVRRNRLEDNVVFAGPQLHSRLPEFFAGGDVFILPSFSEGWPLVVMEALSSGIAVLVSDLPVFTEHPESKRLFRLCKAGDPADIAAAIIGALREKINDLRRKYCRAYAVSELDLQTVGDRYASVIHGILKT